MKQRRTKKLLPKDLLLLVTTHTSSFARVEKDETVIVIGGPYSDEDESYYDCLVETGESPAQFAAGDTGWFVVTEPPREPDQ